ncbi:hypothetical protein ACIQYL_18295 [Lysinibacillus xylanilyticus]|uniref:hypothetical protein n=1 Tax=Lysinibacillus xylanilyticus TaxID=582475 RepID=UPI0037F59A0F
MSKNKPMNSNSTISKNSTTQQDSQKQQQNYETSLWVRNFVAISNCFPNFGKGLCWIFGSLIIFAFVVFLLIGTISADDLIGVVTEYVTK